MVHVPAPHAPLWICALAPQEFAAVNGPIALTLDQLARAAGSATGHAAQANSLLHPHDNEAGDVASLCAVETDAHRLFFKHELK